MIYLNLRIDKTFDDFKSAFGLTDWAEGTYFQNEIIIVDWIGPINGCTGNHANVIIIDDTRFDLSDKPWVTVVTPRSPVRVWM